MLQAAGTRVDRAKIAGPVVEVYPAATLPMWDQRSKGYKGNEHSAASGTEFLIGFAGTFRVEDREVLGPLDSEKLHIGSPDSARFIPLLPLIEDRTDPRVATRVIYFYNRLERDGQARMVTHQHAATSEISVEETATLPAWVRAAFNR